MFFSSVTEINRIIGKRMSNICLKVTKNSKLLFSKFKKFVSRSAFGKLQPTQISLNLQTSCRNLQIRGLGAKLCACFLLL